MFTRKRRPLFFAGLDFDDDGKGEVKIRSSYPVSISGDVEYGFCYGENRDRGLPIFSADVKSDESLWLIIIGTISAL